jgi:hypothetical protein
MTYLLFALWTAIFTALNSVNSRAKNTASRQYNFVSTALVSAAYLLSISFGANLLVQAHLSGRHDLFALAVAVYAFSSAAGSVCGQIYAIKFEKSHHIERS